MANEEWWTDVCDAGYSNARKGEREVQMVGTTTTPLPRFEFASSLSMSAIRKPVEQYMI